MPVDCEERRKTYVQPHEVATIGRESGFAWHVAGDVVGADVERTESGEETGLDNIVTPSPNALAVASLAESEMKAIRIERGAASTLGATGELAQGHAKTNKEGNTEVHGGSRELTSGWDSPYPGARIRPRARAAACFVLVCRETVDEIRNARLVELLCESMQRHARRKARERILERAIGKTVDKLLSGAVGKTEIAEPRQFSKGARAWELGGEVLLEVSKYTNATREIR